MGNTGYYLPLRYIKVSEDVSLCATRIVAMMSTNCHQARETVKKERQNKTLINAAGRSATRTIIILDNGSVVASPFTINRLMKMIEISNGKHISGSQAYATKRMRVYDVADEEPNEDLDEEEPDMTAVIDKDEGEE